MAGGEGRLRRGDVEGHGGGGGEVITGLRGHRGLPKLGARGDLGGGWDAGTGETAGGGVAGGRDARGLSVVGRVRGGRGDLGDFGRVHRVGMPGGSREFLPVILPPWLCGEAQPVGPQLCGQPALGGDGRATPIKLSWRRLTLSTVRLRGASRTNCDLVKVSHWCGEKTGVNQYPLLH